MTTPQTDVRPEELAKLERYLASGGNLLWLIDPEPLRGLDPLAETLGFVLTPGVVVDFAVRPRAGPPVFAVATGYGQHPVTGAFRYNATFPYARQIGVSESEEWQVTPLVDVAQRGWVEVGKLDENPIFDSSRDIRGPVTIAAAYERAVGDRQQRVIVVGGGSFLSNTYLDRGNLQLGIAMVNWLAAEDDLVSIDPRPAPDAQIDIAPMTLYAIAVFFLLVLPVAFVLAGVDRLVATAQSRMRVRPRRPLRSPAVLSRGARRDWCGKMSVARFPETE